MTFVTVFFTFALYCYAPEAGFPVTVPLHRQRVPVKSEDLVLSFKSVYFGTIHLGMPRQQFSVVFDTGSGHVIVPSTGCVNETCAMHQQYNRQASTVAQDVDADGTLVPPGGARDQVTIAFGTGEVTGQFVSERLCLDDNSPHDDARIDGTHESCVKVRVVTATEMSREPFSSFAFDGVLGLGLDTLALAPEFSFFGMMSENMRLAEKHFGVFLADSDDDFSEITFGGYNRERVRAPLSWAPVALPELGYWQVRILRVRVGSRPLPYCEDGQCRAVVDTGTSLLAVPQDFVDPLQLELEKNLQDPPDEGRGVDCRRARGDPVEFDIEGGTLTLGAGDYARQAIQLHEGLDEDEIVARAEALEAGISLPLSDQSFDYSSEAQCHPMIMPLELPAPVGPKLFIFGEPMLKKYYTVYDWERKHIGFGLAAHPSRTKAEAPATAKATPKAAVEPSVTYSKPLLF